ncbi:MAG: transposase [Candidatus Latescibacter sp.]|nr:transposase [Candidatus Latescibacter sp.]
MGYFSEIGRPSLDCRLVIGVLFLKHMTGFSDEEIIKLVNENTCRRSVGWIILRPSL